MCLLKKCDVADELTVNSVVFPKPLKSKRLALSASSSLRARGGERERPHMNSTTTGEAETALSPVITTRIPNLSCWNPQFGSMVLIMHDCVQPVCTLDWEWSDQWWCLHCNPLQQETWMRRCASSTRQGVLHCLGRPAGGPESLIWSEAKNWTRSSHSQGFQQKDSPYTISGFPHACVVSLGTIFRSILFLGKERICIHIYIPPPTVLLAVWCNIMYVV